MNHRVHILISFLILIWCIAIFFEWLIPLNQKLIFVLPILEKTFSLVCHQNEDRLITHNIFHSLVCSRCVGIYLGSLLSSLVFPVIKKTYELPTKYLLIAAIPMLLDKVLVLLHLYLYSKTIAFITGLLLGSIGFFYFYLSINQIIIDKRVKKF